jgi:nitrogen fixation/metabolism regulation signal transduction histidine kinase
MAFSSFRVQVVLQITLILAIGTLLAHLVFTTENYNSMMLVAVALVIAIVALIRHVESVTRKVTRFLLAMRHSDYSQAFTAVEKGRVFTDLAAAMDDVIARLRAARSESEEQAIFLRTLVQHVPVALVGLRHDGEITLFNNAARRLLAVSNPRAIHTCDRLGDSFIEAVMQIQPGEQSISRVTRDGEALQLNLSATLLRRSTDEEKLVCIQDISAELEARELEAFQNLMRVLTHEVMNSITPITSLAESARLEVAALKRDLGDRDEVAEMLTDMRDVIDTIGRRGTGLMRFVNSYREMTRIPEPEIEICAVEELFARIDQLMRPDATERGVALHCEVEPRTLEINADVELMEQALINLLRNALDATEGHDQAAVWTRAAVGRSGQVVLSVHDNGSGLTEEARNNLFVPFFTTKRQGTGVGMSIVRQIIRLHRGTIGVESAPGEGTTISLRF